MARIQIENDDLIVEVEGLDKLWAFKSRLTIPLAHVRGASADAGIVHEPKGVRGPGTHVRGVIVAGTFRQDGDQVFWDVHDPGNAIVIELRDEQYRRLVVEVEDPRAAVATIERAVPA